MIRSSIQSAGLAIVLLALCSCAMPPSRDPLADLRDPAVPDSRRARAVDEAWTLALERPADKPAVREALKNLAWSTAVPAPTRAAALDRLLADPDPAGAADARSAARLMLPREPNPAMVAYLSSLAADRGWTEFTTALVRSLSRAKGGVLEDRPEAIALSRLEPGRGLDEAALQVFAAPQEPDASPALPGMDWAGRARADAWELLSRVDASGEARDHAIDAPGADAPIFTVLRDTRRELGAFPSTGEELEWAASLHAGKSGRYAAWWESASRSVARLDPARTSGLRLRHAEAIRHAADAEPERIQATREALARELESRLSSRRSHSRSAAEDRPAQRVSERFEDHLPSLSWADLVLLLAIDDALTDPAVAGTLFEQAAMDRADRTTEYGGLLMTPSDGPRRAVLFPPRPAQRQGDMRFIASPDMFAQGDLALAHYHFHVQQARNGSYAGPSAGDLDYAARTGRACVVLTSLAEDRLAIDAYFGDSIVIDLGEAARPASISRPASGR